MRRDRGYQALKRLLVQRLALATLVLGVPASVLAADFIYVEDECRGRQLLLQGPIAPGDHARFAERLAQLVHADDLPAVQDPDRLWTLTLDSRGGDLGEALKIGRLVRAALLTTEVGFRYTRRADGVYDYQALPAGDSGVHSNTGPAATGGILVPAECSGACLLVWLAGAERHAHDGRPGFHGSAPATDDAVHADWQQYLVDIEIPESWQERLGAPDWLDWAEYRALAAVPATRLQALTADCPAAPGGAERLDAVMQGEDALRDALDARLLEARRCRNDRLAESRAFTIRSPMH